MTDPLKVEFDFSELNKFEKEFAREIIPEILEQVAISLFGEISREAPVDTGRLAGSVEFPERTSDGFTISINAEYWKYVQFGTGIHGPRHRSFFIFPKDRRRRGQSGSRTTRGKRALRFKMGGTYVFAKVVNNPGQKPNPFIDRAIDTVEGKIDEIADSILARYAA